MGAGAPITCDSWRAPTGFDVAYLPGPPALADAARIPVPVAPHLRPVAGPSEAVVDLEADRFEGGGVGPHEAAPTRVFLALGVGGAKLIQ